MAFPGVTSREVAPELRALNRTFPTITFTADGEIIRANARFSDLVGYSLTELVGRRGEDLLLVEAPEPGWWARLGAGEAAHREFRIRAKDGAELWVEARFSPLENERREVFEVVAIVRDVTRRVREAADERGQIRAINACQAVAHFTLDGQVLEANDQFLDLMGYSREAVIGQSHALFVAPEDAAGPGPLEFWTALAAGEHRSGEFRRIGSDGREVWLQATYSPIFDAAGRPFKIVQYATDVTAERLKQADYEWQVAAIHKSHAVISFDMTGCILDANERFLEAVGYRLDEVVGRHHRMFVEPAYAHSAEYAAFWRDLGKGAHQSGQYRRLDRDGRDVWLQATYNPIFDMAGRPVKIVKYASVVTDEKLRQAEHQGQIAAIHKAQAVIAFDLDGHVLDANDNFLDVMGYRLSDVRGRHHRMFVDEAFAASADYAEFWEGLKLGRHCAGEYRRRTRDGADVWLQAAYSPIFDLSGRPLKIIKYAHDVTAEKLRRADSEGQLAAIDASTGVMSFCVDGTILDANANILSALGYGLDELKGRPHSLLVDPGEARSPDYADFWDRLRAGQHVSGRMRRLGRDGRTVWLQASYNPIFGLNGEVAKIVKHAHDVTADVALAEAYEDAKKQAQHDAATSLPNRSRLTAFLAAELKEPGARVAALYCDIDGFRQISEASGHEVGDRILGEVADRLRRSLRGDQLAARVGGAEFVVVAPHLSEDEIEATCQALLAAIAEPVLIDGDVLKLSLSIGVAVSPDDGVSPDELLRHADTALSRAKAAGRGLYRFFAAEMNERVDAHRKVVDEIRRGLAGGEFFLEFQPRFEPRSQAIRSAEALVRWAHPERGRVGPAGFIAAAERSGLILPLGEWVMRTACATAAQWKGIGISVNVSPVQFRDPGLVAMVRSALEDSGLEPRHLEIEITEGVLLDDADRAHETLTALKALGVTLAIDDFGTGYASLSYLRNYPFDVIKIDRQFIADIDGREGGRAIVQAILGLGRAMGLSVTAEGVETAGQLASLIRDQCSEVQGYLLAHPMPAAKLAEMLDAEREQAPKPKRSRKAA